MFDGTLEYMQINNIKPMAYSPLGSFFSSDNNLLIEKIDKMCSKYSCSQDEILISWILKHESKIYPVIGTTKKDRIIRSSRVEEIEIELIDWFELLEASMGKRLP
jgi:predicted oxidoreductase